MPFHSDARGVGNIRRPRPPSPLAQSVNDTPACALLFAVFLDPLALESPAVGVGSNDPDSISTVRRANGSSRYAVPLRVIPERGQVSENLAVPSTKQSCDVLHDDESRSNVANDSGELNP